MVSNPMLKSMDFKGPYLKIIRNLSNSITEKSVPFFGKPSPHPFEIISKFQINLTKPNTTRIPQAPKKNYKNFKNSTNTLHRTTPFAKPQNHNHNIAINM